MNYPAGSIILYSPFRTFIWSVKHGHWPSAELLMGLILTLPIYLTSFTDYTHVVQYVGQGHYIHTRLGTIRNETEFPPGYLETALVMQPKNWSKDLEREFIKSTGRPNFNMDVLFLTTIFRWAYKLGIIPKTFRENYGRVQCASFIALTWRRAGIDILVNQSIPYVGLYPADFINLPHFEPYLKSEV